MKQLLILFLLILPGWLLEAAVPDTLNLSNNWTFRQAGERWYPASVPGTVHTDLFASNLIPDPFAADNEKNLQWIEEKQWEYRCDFDCTPNIRNSENIYLIFKGLDTYTTVFLNNKRILETDNMFREYTVDIKPHLKAIGNQLLILFQPASARGKEEARKLPFTLPGDEKVFTRKAQYHYGWDWGPRFVTAGIWRPVFIRAWNDAVLEPVQIRQLSVTDQKAKLMAIVSMNVSTEGKYKLTVTGGPTDSIGKTAEVILPVGSSTHRLDFIIPNPKKWWCNGLGKPELYTLYISLYKEDRLVDRIRQRIGIRSLELVNEKDEKGESFYFKLNGTPVFMKGANVIPSDNFLPRVNRARYDSLITLAKESNMNMLRVWGGGVYEADDFYSLCDENGILVWQDFMFACAMYPGDAAFLNSVEAEVRDNVKRLRNHPCIALWCGNNEVDEGWHNWGWQKQYQYSPADSATIYGYYRELFHTRIPSVLQELDPERPYHPSSPRIGWGRKESLLKGDSHYWGVWWGMEPFEVYEQKVGRFMSEYGFQAFPDLRTLAAVIPPEDLRLDSPVLKAHQKHPTGFETIKTYMERDFRVPRSFPHYAYTSQLVQAYGITKAIEAHRRAKPWCMGTLFWQLNDCWPVVSWSSTDYHYRPKALHYALKKSYAPLLISVTTKDSTLSIYLISDKTQQSSGEMIIKLLDFRGKPLYTQQIKDISIGNESLKVFEMPLRQLLNGHSPDEVMLGAWFAVDSAYQAEQYFYFAKPAALKLSKARYHLEITEYQDNSYLIIQSETLVKNMELRLKTDDYSFSDNYFDVLPGTKKAIRLTGLSDTKNLIRNLQITTLNDIINE